MNRKRKEARRKTSSVRVWGHDEARRALPYITSVMRSLREHWIDAQNHDRAAHVLAAQHGRPDRERLIAEAEETRFAREAQDRFADDMEELVALDIYCTDPIRGEGVIPFVHEQKLAWYLYDLFAPDDLPHWRYHSDTADIQRPIAELAEETPRVA